MTSDPFLVLREVAKSYDTRDGPLHAVEAVSLAVGQGEFVAVLGPSGCGKSTLMLMAAGLIAPSAGTVAIAGERVTKPCTDIGIVFQDPVLLDWRTVLGNLMLQADIRGLDRTAMRDRSLALLERVGLAGFAQRYPWELSGGMRQRVSLCRALVHDPSLLLMDEPFGALDALTRDQLNLDLQDAWLARRKTALFITHSISEAVFLADRVVVLTPRPGRIAADFRIDLPRPRTLELRETPAFAAYAARIRALFEGWGVLRERTGTRVAEGVA